MLPTGKTLKDVGCEQIPSIPGTIDPFASEGEIPDPLIAGCLARAYREFYVDGASSVELQLHRNRVQGALRAASVLQCNDFLNSLNNTQATFNFGLGTAATLAAGAGAVVANESVARLLAGSAAVITGSKAEFNADIFFQKTVSALKKAIDQKRAQDVLAMDAKAARAIAEYPVELAVADALDYNADCSLVAGLAALDEAVALAKNPGLDELNRSLVRANVARSILKNNVIDPNVISPDGTPNAALLALNTLNSSRAGRRTADLALSDAENDVNVQIPILRTVLNSNVVLNDMRFAMNRDAALAVLTPFATAYTAALKACETKSGAADTAVRIAEAAIPPDRTDPAFASSTNEYNSAVDTANRLVSSIDQSKRAVLRRIANDRDSLTEAIRAYNRDNTMVIGVTAVLGQFATDFAPPMPPTAWRDEPCP